MALAIAWFAGLGFMVVDGLSARPESCTLSESISFSGRLAVYRTCHGRWTGLANGDPSFVRFVDDQG